MLIISGQGQDVLWLNGCGLDIKSKIKKKNRIARIGMQACVISYLRGEGRRTKSSRPARVTDSI